MHAQQQQQQQQQHISSLKDIFIERFSLLHLTENVDFTFTTLGAVGGEGPQNTSGYLGTPLEGKVQLQDGTQIWEVPETGTYEIEARGASGANGTNSSDPKVWKLGGRGARIRGQFYLRRGTKLKILVGQRGSTIPISLTQPGTGGGGSFVTTMDNEPLIIAGGGGGGASPSPGWEDGDPGQAGRNGSQHGGTEGSGGKLFKDGVAVFLAGAGGGLLTDGQGTVVPVLVKGGQSFLGGGRGGRNSAVDDGKGFGGFGGGGGANADPGGGGGFSGGGVTKTKNLCKAGGGGSYNGGTQQINKAGFNKGDGQVSIKLL